MVWIHSSVLYIFHWVCIKIFCHFNYRAPRHIAFIMDGNRRYAKKYNVFTQLGHYKGFTKISEIIRWCLDLQIEEITMYAFSIENFKRSQTEVNTLMSLATVKFQELLIEIDQINEWGVRVHIAGRLSLLPEDLKALVSKAMLITRRNNKLRLNIAYAYTGRDEISRAASHIVDGVWNNDINAQDIDAELVTKSLELTEPELMVRTSGEVRLSDFMLWQVSNTVLYFTDVLWPEFTIWNLLVAIIHFQRYAPPPKKPKCISRDKQLFLDKLEHQRLKQLEKYVSC